jgi:predicted nucleotide-binding protein
LSEDLADKGLEALEKSARDVASHLLRRRSDRPDKARPLGTKIFIGHGRSPVWRELKDFIEHRLKIPVDEFNSISVAGIPTTDRLSEMLNAAAFAFLVLTAEDEQPDGRMRARENVVHEVGLFQGRLGFERAIVLLEEGCEEFSNIHGLGQICFPQGVSSQDSSKFVQSWSVKVSSSKPTSIKQATPTNALKCRRLRRYKQSSC